MQKTNDGPPDSDFTPEAKARAAALKDTCAKECVGFLKKYVTMLKDVGAKHGDCATALWTFNDCVANCAAKKQKLHEIEPLAACSLLQININI